MKFTTILYRLRHIVFRGAIKIIKFPNPELIQGENAIKQLAERIKSDGLSKVLIVTDANLHKIGLLDSLKEALKAESIEDGFKKVGKPAAVVPLWTVLKLQHVAW